MNVVLLRDGALIDQVERLPRRLPDGSVGVEYLGIVYPVGPDRQVDLNGSWYYPAQAPIYLDPPEHPLDPASTFWMMEADGGRPYLFLNGSEQLFTTPSGY